MEMYLKVHILQNVKCKYFNKFYCSYINAYVLCTTYVHMCVLKQQCDWNKSVFIRVEIFGIKGAKTEMKWNVVQYKILQEEHQEQQ